VLIAEIMKKIVSIVIDDIYGKENTSVRKAFLKELKTIQKLKK